MKIIHTSDWHLGHQLHGYNREYEHQAFLSKTLPNLDVVMIGGNHDSPSKLDAPHELLKAFDLMLVPITNKEQQIAAYVLAVPFLRSADLRTDNLDENDDRLIKGVEVLYSEMTQAARKLLTPEQAMIGMGHAYMASGQLSEMSERRVLGGNQHALPASIFADDMSYVALGHLHLAQKVAKKEHVRYSGSPIPLSMSERNYKHQILAVELDGNEVTAIDEINIPRSVDMLKVPAKPARNSHF